MAQFATNFRDGINSWNLATNRWLRHVVYERVPKRYGTVLTFGLSAVWHGFYPGYYLTFASGALMVMAARIVSGKLLHTIQWKCVNLILFAQLGTQAHPTSLSENARHQAIVRHRDGDCDACFHGVFNFPVCCSRAAGKLTSTTLAFKTNVHTHICFQASLNMYLSVLFCLHAVAAISIFAIPQMWGTSFVGRHPIDNGHQAHTKQHSQSNGNGWHNASAAQTSNTKTITKDHNTTDNCDISSSNNGHTSMTITKRVASSAAESASLLCQPSSQQTATAGVAAQQHGNGGAAFIRTAMSNAQF